MSEHTRLYAEQLRLSYGQRVICPQLNVAVPDGSFTVIVGPNGCGKSTLLRSLCRLLTPNQGQVYLDAVKRYSVIPLKS